MSTNSKERLRQLLAQHKTSQHTSIEPEPVESIVEPVEVAVEPVPVVEPELVSEPVIESVAEPVVEPVVESVTEPVVEPVTELDAPIDLTETRVLSKDEIKESLDHISQLTAKLESFKGSSEPVLDSSNVDLIEPVPSVETVDVPETALSRSEDVVSGRDEFVEGMVEGLPDFKSDAVPEAVSSEVEDTLADDSDDTLEDNSDDKAELIDGETLIESSDLPTFDDQEPALVKKPKFVERAIAVAKRKPGLIVTVCGIALVAALIGVAAMTPSSKKSTPSSSANAKVVKSLAKSSSTSSSKKSLSIEEQLTATAKGMDAPYKVEVEDLVGGYKLGKITYYPDNEAKRYTDASLHAPEKAEAVDTSDAAKAITDELSKDLPTINSTIKVKDKAKVSFETYAKDDGYITILLYNKKPFGYVTTDKDGYKTNHVTTFYVSDVAADA
jgi:DNA polymerase III, gamma subunit / DNA polymerase III, tau subunit